jgi:hypothetical protein
LVINVLALWVMFTDEERMGMDWQQRVWGYTGAAGMIQGLATGYFLWDLMVSIQNAKLFGPGMLAHAISALVVFSFGFVSALNPGLPQFTNFPTETIRQLLRLHLYPLRALYSIPKLPLVL